MAIDPEPTETTLGAEEGVLRAVMEGTSRATGEAFFPAMVENLARALKTRYAIIGCLEAGDAPGIRTLAVWDGDGPGEDLRYDLRGSPCERVLERSTCFFPERVVSLFPHDALLAELKVECYVGTPLITDSGEAVGVLVVMDDRPMDPARIPMTAMVLEIFASRATAELDRSRAHRALLEHKLRLEELVEERTADLKRSEDRLERSSRLASLGTLASGIAHELNNPLGIIRLVCESFEPHPDRSTDWQEVRDRVVESVERCKQIVAGIRRFALDEPSPKTWLDLEECIRASIELCRGEAVRRQVELALEVDGAPARPEILANRTELQQLLVNLIENALLSSGVGRVRIRLGPGAEDGRGCWTLEVEDDGAGVAQEDLPRIFDPFFTTRLDEGGTGLGLSVCHGIVRDHGGEIDVWSAPGSGCRVRVELPGARVEPEPSAQPEAGASLKPGEEKGAA